MVLLLVSSAANYFMFQRGIYIDTDMIRNIFQTNRRQAFELITSSALLCLFALGVLPATWIFKVTHIVWRIRQGNNRPYVNFSPVFLRHRIKEIIVWGRNHKPVTQLINTGN